MYDPIVGIYGIIAVKVVMPLCILLIIAFYLNLLRKYTEIVDICPKSMNRKIYKHCSLIIKKVRKMEFKVEELEEVSPKHPCAYLGFAWMLK